MKTLWKEWQQQKWLFLLFCIAGISFPILEVISNWRRNGKFHSDSGSAIVVGFGALFAILLSIATTNSDTKRGVDDFLLSKPIRVRKLFITKIVLAAVLLFIAFLFVSSLGFAGFFSERFFWDYIFSKIWVTICYTHPISLMLFAATMFLVVLLRDTAKAVLMAIWAALMVYFLPLLVGSLKWMNLFEQLHDTRARPSVVKYLIWSSSLPQYFGTADIEQLPSAIPVAVNHMTWFQALSEIVSSPAYLQYLLFVAVTTIVSVICIILSVKAVKNRWRWQPGQKTIVWTIGLSAAFIFGVSMLQVGHNLEFVTTHKNREIYPKRSLREKTVNKYNWTSETIGDDRFDRSLGAASTACYKDDLMFRISTGAQLTKEFFTGPAKDRPRLHLGTPLKQHYFLDIYRLPYINESFHLSETRFFVTESIGRNYTQSILGSFVRDDRLYVAYRPVLPDPQPENERWPIQSVLRFMVVDVSNPNEPELISDTEMSRSDNLWTGTMINYNEYCYVNAGHQIFIVSVANRDKPEVVRQFDNDQFPGRQVSIVNNKMICKGDENIAIFDLSDPLFPELIFSKEVENLGAIACAKDIIYIAKESGIFVYKLIEDENGNLVSELIGKRSATPLEKLAGRKPKDLLFHNGYLVENASHFGVLVYDVSNPARPKRAFHGNTPSLTTDIGVWNDLFYMESYGNELVFLDIPKAKK